MKLKSEFLVQELNDSFILVPLDNSLKGVIKTNKSAAFIIECLKEETSIEEMIKKLTAKYDIDEKTAENNIKKVIDKLQEIDALI